jgi:hypothetical protein
MLRWDNKLTDEFLNTVQRISEHADCYLLECLPDFGAVELVKNCLKKK